MKIKGSIENIIFRNDVNGWTVLLVKSGKTVFTLTGNIVSISGGENIEAQVEEVNHPTFGLQYKISSYTLEVPNKDETAIYKFLMSLQVKGLGEATIKRLISSFGIGVIEVIKNEPERLDTIKGMNSIKTEELRKKLIDKENEIDVVIELEKYELGTQTIKKILEKYGNETLSIIKENPFKLAIDIEGIGFNICDKIAKLNGFNDDGSKRLMAGIMYVLEMNYGQGNVYVKRETLEKEVQSLLEIEYSEDFEDAYYNLEIDLKIKRDAYSDEELFFLRSAYNTEKMLSKVLYDKRDNIVILTGGPGTGKTYNIKKYLGEAYDKGIKVALCAPTGRAAKRITEVTGYDAKTIHRLLECNGDVNGFKLFFNKNDENKLDIDMLIVDEMSMVDEYLMLALMNATPSYTKIILVGDVDQLPSVGAGQVLKDMIDSNLFNVNKLTEIHRQTEGSNIVVNAHLINDGKMAVFDKNYEDFIFTHKNSDERIRETIKILVNENLPKHFNIGIDQIQVICPSKKGNCGTEILNKVLQETLNPESFEKEEIKVGDTIFRIGDKVMQTSNNYNIPYDVLTRDGKIIDRGVGIFNGDIGEIVEIDEDIRSVVIRFDDREAYYISKDLSDLSLAYAITVHKSQGSEYDVVVMPMARAPYQLLNRKILYTAITRAKKCIIFVGQENYFNEMIENNNEVERNSALCSKLYLYDI